MQFIKRLVNGLFPMAAKQLGVVLCEIKVTFIMLN